MFNNFKKPLLISLIALTITSSISAADSEHAKSDPKSDTENDFVSRSLAQYSSNDPKTLELRKNKFIHDAERELARLREFQEAVAPERLQDSVSLSVREEIAVMMGWLDRAAEEVKKTGIKQKDVLRAVRFAESCLLRSRIDMFALVNAFVFKDKINTFYNPKGLFFKVLWKAKGWHHAIERPEDHFIGYWHRGARYLNINDEELSQTVDKLLLAQGEERGRALIASLNEMNPAEKHFNQRHIMASLQVKQTIVNLLQDEDLKCRAVRLKKA